MGFWRVRNSILLCIMDKFDERERVTVTRDPRDIRGYLGERIRKFCHPHRSRI